MEIKYQEFTTEEFAKFFPEMWNQMPMQMKLEFMSDPKYRFKIQPLPNGRTAVEIGYPEDNWLID